MGTAELKPCPFCGGDAEIHESYDGFFVGQCNRCGNGTLNFKEKHEAVRRWNRRQAVENKMEQLAAIFGKKLDENFMVRFEDINGRKYSFRCHFSRHGLMRNRSESSGGLLTMLLTGKAEIVEGDQGMELEGE